MCIRDSDNALSQSPADFEELLKLLQEYGCEVSKRGKSYRLKLSGWEKAPDNYKKTGGIKNGLSGK